MADANKNPSVDDVFDEVMRRSPGEAREAYLGEVCGDDSSLRQRVSRLVKASEEAHSFLESPAIDLPSDSSIAEKPGDGIGAFKLLQQIGEGGFGVVYMAEQLRPVKRKVALKIIKPGMDTKEVMARFDAERQAMALMDHANIAKVFDGGATDSGRPYFVMELVKGVALTEFCDTNRLTMRQRLELLSQVCRAIQHAHQKGVIHRDIKPTNVMVTLHDGKPVPKVIDFGVAKAVGHELTEQTMFTAYGQMIGTPQYMSPEQAEMSGLDVDTRSDVYSLGVLLYELITGTTPLEKKTIQQSAYHELLRQIREVDAPKPSARISTLNASQQTAVANQRKIGPKSLRQLLHGDLDRVVLKALTKDREQRYETPKDLAADIERFLDDKPVQAVPPSLRYLTRKYFQRHKTAILVSVVLIGTLIAATTVSTWLAIRATIAAQNAAIARDNWAHIADENRRLLYVDNMKLADQLWSRPDGSPRQIEELLAAWIPVDDDQSDLREFSWRYQWTRLHLGAEQFVIDANAVTISPSGNLVTANDQGIFEWDAAGKCSRHWFGDASKGVLSNDGRWAVVPAAQGAKLIDIRSGETVRQLRGTEHAFSQFSKYVAYRGADHEFHVLAVRSGDSVLQTTRHIPETGSFHHLSDLKVAPAGKSFMVRNVKEVAAFLDGRESPITWRGPTLISSFAWTPDGKFMVMGRLDGKIEFRPIVHPEHVILIGAHGNQVSVIAFSDDGTHLASGGSDGTVSIWDVSNLHTDQGRVPSTPIRQLKAHVDEVQAIVLSDSASKLATLDTGGVGKLWKLEERDRNIYEIEMLTSEDPSGRLGIEWDATEDGVCVAHILDGSSAEMSRQIQLGDRIVGVSSPSEPKTMDVREMHERDVLERIEIGRYGSRVRLHMMQSDRHEEYVVELDRNLRYDALFRLEFAPEGDELTVAGYRVGATRWTETGKNMKRFPALGASIDYSPDGRLLALAAGASIQLWERASDKLYKTVDARVGGNPIPPRNRRGGSLAFSPDSSYLAIGTCFPFNHSPKRSDLRVWRIPELTEIGAPLHKNDHVLASVLFTPDGKQLVTLDHGGVIRTWDTTTWEPEHEWEIEQVQQAHSQFEGPDWQREFITKATAMDLSPDGRILAVGFGGYAYESNREVEESGVILIDFHTQRPLRVMTGHRPYGLVFLPDSLDAKTTKTLVSTGRDHRVVLWDVHTGMQLRELRGHTSTVSAIDHSPDGEILATADTDHVLKIWRAASLDHVDRDPRTIRSLYRLGLSQGSQGNHLKALTTLRRALALQEKALPSNHPDILKTRAEIAAIRKADIKNSGTPVPTDNIPFQLE